MNADLDLNGYALLNAIIPVDGYTLVGATLGSLSTQSSSAVNITGGTISGVTLSSITFSGTQAFANVKITGTILDTNSNEVIAVGSAASAVNALTIGNAATGGSPYLSAFGDDTDIGIDFNTKAAGTFNFRGNSSTSAILKLYEDTDNGSNYVALKAPASIASNLTFTLPTTDVTNGYMKSDGSGNLSLVALTASVFTAAYASAQTSYTNGGTFTLTHGLGATPTIVTGELVCQISEYGYSVNDVVIHPCMLESDAAGYGFNVTKNSTQLVVRIGNGGIILGNKGTGAQSLLTVANWKIVLRAFV